MLPKDKIVIDGTTPSEGGEIDISHPEPARPGQTIEPQQNRDLKPFDDELKSNVNDIDQHTVEGPEIVIEGGSVEPTNEQLQPAGQLPQEANNNQPDAKSQETTLQQDLPKADSRYNNVLPSSQNQPEYSPPLDHSGMYSTNPAAAGLNPNYHPAKSVIATPENVNPANLNRGFSQNINNSYPKRQSNLKRIMLVVLPILIVVGGLVYVFAFYLPNTPQNVWNTSINRTGDQIDLLVNKLKDEDALLAYEKTKIKVEGNLETDGQKFQINVDSNYDSKNSDSRAAVQSDDGEGGVLQLEALVKTNLPDEAQFPNIYFNLKGFKDLGLDEYLGTLVQYDGKWIAIEQDYINSLIDSTPLDTEENQEQKLPTYEDYMSMVNDANEVTQKYLFNSEPESSVLALKDFIATEKSEGITANHYKAGINGQNLKNWCNDLTDKLASNDTFKELSGVAGEDLQEEIDKSKQECEEAGNNINEEDDFDIWMDKKNKIIHKIRIYEKASDYTADINESQKQEDYENCLTDNNGDESACSGILSTNVDTEQKLNNKYYEIGQVYKGRSQVMLFYNWVEESRDLNSNIRAEITLNTDNLAFSGKISAVTKSEYSGMNLFLSIDTEPYAEDIDSAKPDGAIPIQEFLNTVLGTDDLYGDLQANARDVERQSEITSIYTAVEAYYAQNGTYPSLKQMNDSEFRRDNLNGLEEDTFTDPGAPSSYLSDRSGINTYSYVVVPTSCDGKSKLCTYYELSAILDDGSLYTKKAFN